MNEGTATAVEAQEKESIELDETTVAFLNDVREESRRKVAEIVMPFMNQEQAAVQLFIRRNKLEGQWRLSEDGKSITKEG